MLTEAAVYLLSYFYYVIIALSNKVFLDPLTNCLWLHYIVVCPLSSSATDSVIATGNCD